MNRLTREINWYTRYRLRRWECNRLKRMIRHRLATEDFTRRIPRPRVRYKLTQNYYHQSGTKFRLVWS